MSGWMVNLSVEQLHPHPDNPRKDLGDLTELADSIRQNGIFQNLTVVPDDESMKSFTVIIGHRRLAAAKLAGLLEVPCAVVEMDRREQLQTMLLENMQRSDLTPWEQAQGFQLMFDLGDSIETIAEKSGFSKKTVRSRLKMAELDQNVLKQVSGERQISIADLDELAKIEDLAARNRVLQEIGTSNFGFTLRRTLREQAVQKVLPEAKKFLRYLKCKKLKENDQWNVQYEQVGETADVCLWVGEAVLPVKSKEQIYYWLDERAGRLTFFQERKRAKPVKKSPELLEKEKRIAAIWAEADGLAEVSYKLRSEFVGQLAQTGKNTVPVLYGALIAGVIKAVDYTSTDRDTLETLLGLESSYSPERGAIALKALLAADGKIIPKVIYTLFDDSPKKTTFGGYKGSWPEYRPNGNLVGLYEWLTGLGYQISNEEQQMIDGTHELFRKLEDGT